MVSDLELAVFSYRSYNPSPLNDISVSGWTPDPLTRSNPASGFAASVYRNGDEIAIAFRGTNTQSFGELVNDFYDGNTPAAYGWASEQVKDAIRQVTGHARAGSPRKSGNTR